jgi:hypothetical protein
MVRVINDQHSARPWLDRKKSTSMDLCPGLPSKGARLSLHGDLGSVRFVGEVDGTTGIWLGVEWDDPCRGKHDGVKGGKRYFTCR